MDLIEDIFKKARAATLSPDEKAAVRANLATFMTLTPARPPRSLRARMLSRAAGVTGLVTTLLASAAGVSYAAEGALPGDVLYPVKIRVNEEVRVALAPTPEKKAEVEAERAERRLVEAEQLAQRGELTETTRVAIEADFKAHAEKASQPEAAARLEGTLIAHRQIVAALSVDRRRNGWQAGDAADGTSDDGDERGGRRDRNGRREEHSQIVALGAAIDAAGISVRLGDEIGIGGARAGQDAGDTSSEGIRTDARVRARREIAVRAVAEARTALAAASGRMSADDVERAGARLDRAEQAVAEGDGQALSGNADAAVGAYARAARAAYESRALFDAQGKLRLRVLFDDEPNEEPKDAADGSRDDDRDEDRGADALLEGAINDGRVR